jgi:serine/threonine protein kinase
MKPETPAAGSPEPTTEVLRILEKYAEELERGNRPKADDLLAQHPELADHLRGCLASLEFLYQAESNPDSANSQLTASPQDQLGGRLGDFRIIRQVGRGGMGVVYEAEQISLKRRVALKVLPFAGAMDPKLLQRFQNEAQAAAGLHHTNIVPVYAVGSERGVHYYAMQFIEGRTLAALIQDLRQQESEDRGSRMENRGTSEAKRHPLSSILNPRAHRPPDDADFIMVDPVGGKGPAVTVSQQESDDSPLPDTMVAPTQLYREPGASSTVEAKATLLSRKSPAFFRHAAELGRQAANGSEFAHARGVIHRDIKPANLLIDEQGNLWVADFGLARLPTDLSLTLSGDFLGTLPYMSPEQALGEHALVDQRTDVYSLGMTLYELLTLEVAFTGRNREELLRQIAFDEPRPLRKSNPAVPTDLETIVLKAIAKCPEERYATAQELADDLGRFLEDKPIRARRPTLEQRLRKLVKRHRGIMWTLGTCGTVAMILAIIGMYIHNRQINSALSQETKQRQRAEATAELVYQVLDEVVKGAANAILEGSDEREVLRNALVYFKRVAQENDNISRFKLGQTQLWIAYYQRQLGEKPEQVEATLQDAIRCFDELARASPADFGSRDQLAQCYSALAMVLGEDMGRSEEGIVAVEDAVAIYQELAKNMPIYHVMATNERMDKALLLHSLGRYQEAEAIYNDCLKYEATLDPPCPLNMNFFFNQCAARFNLARLMKATGRPEGAEKDFRQVVNNFTRLWEIDSKHPPYYRAKLAVTYYHLGLTLQATGKTGEAEDSFRRALKLQEELVRQFPSVPDHRLDLSASQQDLAVLLKSQGQRDQADDYFRRCQHLLEKLTADFSHVSLYQSDLAKYYSNRGTYFREEKRMKLAETYFRDAVRVYEKLIAEKDAPDFRAELANCHINLGELLQETGKLQEAEAAYRRALELFTQLPADFTLMPDFQSNLGTVYSNLAGVHLAKDELKTAWQLALRGFCHHLNALSKNPKNPFYPRFFHHNLRVLGHILIRQAKDCWPPQWAACHAAAKSTT